MYNSCSISSSVLSVRSYGSLSFSFNDCSSSVFNSSIDKTPFLSSSPSPCPSSCCSSCACFCSTFTATATHRLPITPCFLYGLRQSALVHRSPSRGFISPAGYRCLLQFPSCDFDRAAFEASTGSRFSRKAKGRFRCVVWEDNTASSRYLLGGADAAEAMISLLSEAVDGECLGTGEINRRSYKIVEVNKAMDYNSKCSSLKKSSKKVDNKTSYGNECKNEAKRKLQLDERGGRANECYRQNTRTVGSGLLESDSKDEYNYVAVESREERRKVKNESSLRAEHLGGRTGSSSCSSYYSLSSSGDLESDTELPEQEHFVEELIRDEISRTEGQVAEGRKRDNAGGNSVDWDLRKKSEKKLAEVSAEEIQSGTKYSEEYARRVKNDASDYAKRSSSHEQVDVNDWEIRKQHTRTNNQVIGLSKSRRKSQEVREMSKIHVSDVGMTSQEKQFTGREANVRVSEIRESAERISTLQQQSESRMKIEEEDKNLVQSRSGSKMKIWEEDTTMDQSSFQQIRKQQQQRDERITGQLEMRRKSECSSEINEAKNKKTSILQSRTQKMKSDDTSSLKSTSDQKLPQRIEPDNGMQTITNISVVHADNTKIVTNTQISSGERVVEHESNFTPGLGRNNERSEIHNEANGRVQQKKSRKENLKPASVSSSWGKAGEGSSFQASLSLVSETREQKSHADLEESEKRSKEDVLIPPQPQAIAGGLLHDSSMTRIFTGEASGETKSGSTTSYMHSRGRTTFSHHEPDARKRSEIHGESINMTTHEDSLDSGQRLEESSSQFVGDLVEKARHDILTSGVQQGNISSDFTSAYEGDKHGPSSSGQNGKEDLKMKRHDFRQSSKGSGGKGPSDEMWDVTDPSVQEPLQAEVPLQTSTSEHAIIKRSGRSLWTLMGDIARLRWSSRAQAPSSSSAARSGGRTSPDDSVRSETWFSGHETNGNSEENRERSNLASEVISHQLGQGTQGEGDFSDSTRTTEKLRQVEGNISPSSNIYETATAPEVISLTSQKEKHEGSSFEVASSGKEVVQSSLPLPAGSTRTSLVVEEISEPDKINIQGTGSMRTMEQPLGVRVAEASGSEGKEGELKQRKLQRTKQVPRDRFDEWEEAYRLEREQQKIDEMFMREALLEAKKAADSWEVPVGAVLVQHGKIIARGRNLVEELRDSTAHAEMICIQEASSILRSWRLAETTLYVTLEPCPMCAGAILQARIDTVVWGAPNKLLGADGSWIRLFPDGRGANGSEVTDKPAAPVHPFHPNMRIRRGILTSECADMMQQFFQLRRKNKGKNAEQPQSPSCLPITSHRSKFFNKMHDILHLMFCL